MQTGATIHTMNGLNMNIKKSTGIPERDGWWEEQHLKRGLSKNGRRISEVETSLHHHI